MQTRAPLCSLVCYAATLQDAELSHTLGKPVILLAQTIEDVPFDVRHNRIILYGTRFDEISKLKEQLQRAIDSVRADIIASYGLVEPS